jgi:hypothetical protein
MIIRIAILTAWASAFSLAPALAENLYVQLGHGRDKPAKVVKTKQPTNAVNTIWNPAKNLDIGVDVIGKRKSPANNNR